MGSFLAHNGFILIPLSNYWLLNMGLYWFDSKLIFAHFRLYCGKRIPIIKFYNSIMGFYNFEDGLGYCINGFIFCPLWPVFWGKWLMMRYYSFQNGLVYYTLWTYVFPMMACLIEKPFWLWEQYFRHRIILCWL